MADDDVSSLLSFSLCKKKKASLKKRPREFERASEPELPVRSASEERERESERKRALMFSLSTNERETGKNERVIYFQKFSLFCFFLFRPPHHASVPPAPRRGPGRAGPLRRVVGRPLCQLDRAPRRRAPRRARPGAAAGQGEKKEEFFCFFLWLRWWFALLFFSFSASVFSTPGTPFSGPARHTNGEGHVSRQRLEGEHGR